MGVDLEQYSFMVMISPQNFASPLMVGNATVVVANMSTCNLPNP
jgi:hypothetical protein